MTKQRTHRQIKYKQDTDRFFLVSSPVNFIFFILMKLFAKDYLTSEASAAASADGPAASAVSEALSVVFRQCLYHLEEPSGYLQKHQAASAPVFF